MPYCVLPGNVINPGPNKEHAANSDSDHTKVIVGFSVAVGVLILIGIVMLVVVMKYRKKSKRLYSGKF